MKEQPKFSPKEIEELSKGLSRQKPNQKPAPKTAERVVTSKNVTYNEKEFEEATSKNNIVSLKKKTSPETKIPETNNEEIEEVKKQEKPSDYSSLLLEFAEQKNINLKNISITEVIAQIRNHRLRQQLLTIVDANNKDLLPNLPRILNSPEFSELQKKAVFHSIKLSLKNIDDKNKKLGQK